MGKKRKELSPMDALFQELGRLSRDGKADEALLAFDRAKADLSGPFEPRVYHKLLALTVDRPAEAASLRQHMQEHGVAPDEAVVRASAHRCPPRLRRCRLRTHR